MARFSIVIPLYNKEKDIEATLQSVLEQSHSDFEIVLVDDGSKDNGVAKAEGVSDDRIKIFSKKNEGVAIARNFGVAKANNEFIAFLDADDYWHPTHLEDINTLIEKHPNAQWFATAYEKNFNTNLLVPFDGPIMKSTNAYVSVSNYFENCLIDSISWTSAMCFKKTFFDRLNGFDTAITHGAGEDTDLWIRAALKEPLAFCTKISARYNLEGSNRISLTPTKKRAFMDPDNFEEAAQKDSDLKKYLDLNRYSFALQHKLAGDQESFRKFLKNLDTKNISSKQRMLLKLPNFTLKILLKIQGGLRSSGVQTTSFRG